MIDNYVKEQLRHSGHYSGVQPIWWLACSPLNAKHFFYKSCSRKDLYAVTKTRLQSFCVSLWISGFPSNVSLDFINV